MRMIVLLVRYTVFKHDLFISPSVGTYCLSSYFFLSTKSQSLLAYLYASSTRPRLWSAFAGLRVRPVALVPVPLHTASPPWRIAPRLIVCGLPDLKQLSANRSTRQDIYALNINLSCITKSLVSEIFQISYVYCRLLTVLKFCIKHDRAFCPVIKYYLLTYLLTYRYLHLLAYLLTHSLTHLLTHSHPHSLPHSLTYLLTSLLYYLLTYLLAYLLTCLLAYLLTYKFKHFSVAAACQHCPLSSSRNCGILYTCIM